jgi:hypothetical protein
LGNFSTFFVDLVHFSGFGIMYQQKSGNPALVSRPTLVFSGPEDV